MASIIGVETLQHTNGTTAATIDSSGRLLQPNLPSVTVGGTNNAYVAVAAGGILPFNKVRYGNSSLYDTSTYKFTAPVDGTYLVTANVLLDGNGSTHLDLKLNGSTVHRGGDGSTSSGRMEKAMFVLTVSSGDELAWHVNLADSYYMDSSHSYASYTLLG